MTDVLVSTVMGLSAVVLAVALSLPQLLKILRTRLVTGVSLAAVANSTISFGAWTVYAATIDDVWLLASSAVGIPGQVVTTWITWRHCAERRELRLPAAWLATLASVTAADVLLGTSLAPLTVGASILWYVVPALARAWGSADVSGIAAGTWWVLVAEGAIFLAYGLAAGVPATVVYGVVCMTGSAGVLLRLVLGDRSPAPEAAPEVRELALR